jgi:NHL repeat
MTMNNNYDNTLSGRVAGSGGDVAAGLLGAVAGGRDARSPAGSGSRRRLVVALLAVGVLLLTASAASARAEYSVSHFGEHNCGEAEAGQLCSPVGVGVDAAGDAYAADLYDYRIDKFDMSGHFLLAFGWGVRDGKEELETCTVTTECRTGSLGSGTTQFALPSGVAVDGSGDVYVFDFGHYRVEKFDPEGKFLLMFGGEVDKTTHADVCTAESHDVCGPGVAGTGNGQFGGSANFRSYIAVGGPQGSVYVGDRGRVQVFEPSGPKLETIAYRETLSLAGLSSTGKVTALAVDGLGDVFVKIGDTAGNREGAVPGVREFEPGGIERAVQFDALSETVEAVTLDGSGHVYVADSAGGNHIVEYDVASGEELAAFGFDTIPAGRGIVCSVCGMAFSALNDKLYASGEGVIWAYTPPEAGPLIEPGSEKVTPEPRGAATFEATVNPEGNATEVKVEYIDEAHYKTGGFAGAASSASVSIGSSFEDQAVQVKLPKGTLTPGTGYHYRVAAVSPPASATPQGMGPDQSFTEIPAALVEGPWVTEVSSTSATLSARIDPAGANTSYRLEYGTSTAYETVLAGSVGEGEEYVPVSYHRQGLTAGTTYHYRLLTTSTVGVVEVVDRTFTTQPASGSGGLPDGRAWELVSPADSHGALIEPVSGTGGDIQAAADGGAIGYLASGPVTSDPPASVGAYIVSTRRGPDLWASQEIMPSPRLPEGETGAGELLHTYTPPLLFSPDMSRSVIEPSLEVSPSSLSPQASERTIFLHDTASGAWTPLVTCANVVSPCPKFGGKEPDNEMEFLATSRDLSHVVFVSPFALTPGAESLLNSKEECPDPLGCSYSERNIYEWSDGQLRQVNILPDEKPTFDALLGRHDVDVIHTISDDGRWVVWQYVPENRPGALYVRDMVGGRTVQVGGSNAVFETMSSDGSRVFFLDGARVNGSVSYNLYEFDTATGVTTDMTANHGPGESSAGVRDAVVGASEDGSYVYFVAGGVLAEGAVSEGDNLYVAHEEGGAWKIKLIATLSNDDEKDWSALNCRLFQCSEKVILNEKVTSRVSPNGRFVSFMSNRSLTGYDNVDANPNAHEMKEEKENLVKKWGVVVDKEGRPVPAHDEEVYEYDAVSGRLVCVSCDPSGARPVGVFDSGGGTGSLLVDRYGAWGGHWLAGSLGGWRGEEGEKAVYQPRNLSNSGRLFFASPDALVPRDTNGLEDVYEYEPVKAPEGPASNDCSSASPRFGEHSNGCVSLISSGTSGAESAFYDASESGDDAFFATTSRLVGADYDDSIDVYDAHVCSASAPCASETELPPPCDSGDSCKGAPSPQPEIFGPAPSATFSGTGNVAQPAQPRVKPKSLTRAQKLAAALRACRKKKSKPRLRLACERNAHRRYARKAAKGRSGR